MILHVCILLILAVISVTDLRKKEILSWELVLAGGISVFSIVKDIAGKEAEPFMILLSLVPGIALLAISFITREGIGYGDGLLVLLLGPALGFYTLMCALAAAFFASAIVSGVLLISKRAGKKKRIPFVPFLTAGMGVALFAAI